jgi:hypothetical protein
MAIIGNIPYFQTNPSIFGNMFLTCVEPFGFPDVAKVLDRDILRMFESFSKLVGGPMKPGRFAELRNLTMKRSTSFKQ